MWFQITLKGGKITTEDGLTITRESTRERYWIAGKDTWLPGDDEYLIWGNVSGVDVQGEAYSRTIKDSLHVNLACRFIVEGLIELQRGNETSITINYGAGNCDASATISKDGESKMITGYSDDTDPPFRSY